MANNFELIRPKKYWKNTSTHYLNVINDSWYKSLVEVQDLINYYTVEFYKEKDIKTLFLPITTGSISSPMGLGSDSLPVSVEMFGIKSYLADSMQFMLEYGCRLFENGCYYIMPSFRGELPDHRHLCQFYHSEAEIPGGLDDVIQLVEEYISFLSRKILNDFGDKLLNINGSNRHIEKMAYLQEPLPRITLDEAVNILEDSDEYVDKHSAGFKSINSKGELKLISMFGGAVWLTHFDHLSVPFYQKFDSVDQSKALNADLLMGIGELVGSGERHETSQDLIKALNFHKVPLKNYKWYKDMKENYPLKTSGFGMGIERFILWLFNHNDIRDCEVLPRINGKNILP
ncbi:asparagine synthetase A [Paenactinomyces guangxiensis]|uniref:Asparaginase n=1 Tax=Paenactinomyces guangxiensis TaxID=1490290 RepID=A0A7W2A860_9BACL|nr:asparagine synthetase A [Paenactinomyces guangxiensis]MBA4493473.1 asparaginase [Paenactinomyces guangxiensis]MBH8590564.1 asparaginase [Paenactinomyces guangxiensis]